tara:strand:+ start:723 stop:836 length:114 start_codon:yes stop_codon:yes gene_type:complete
VFAEQSGDFGAFLAVGLILLLHKGKIPMPPNPFVIDH